MSATVADVLGAVADRFALETAFRGIVVARGTEPMPVREQLPLTLPPQAAEQLARQQAAGQPSPGQPVAGQRPAGPDA